MGSFRWLLGSLGCLLGLWDASGVSLGLSWVPLGCLLNPSWAHFGLTRVPHGPFGVLLGPSGGSWAALGRSWGFLWASWGGSWGSLGASWGPLGASSNNMLFLIFLKSVLGPKWGRLGAIWVASEHGVCRGDWRKKGLTASCCNIIFDHLFYLFLGPILGPKIASENGACRGGWRKKGFRKKDEKRGRHPPRDSQP